MADWRQLIARLADRADDGFDLLKERLDRRLGGDDPIKIVAYRGYGTAQRFYLRGRVLDDEGLRPPTDRDSLWDNLVNMYKRFESDEIPGARVVARYGAVEQEAVTDAEGFFEIWLDLPEPAPSDTLWHTVQLELLAPAPPSGPVTTTCQVLVPPASARIGVISDIDDTVVKTDVTNELQMARIVFLGNARTRLPFEGVAAFYRALHDGPRGGEANPIWYVTSSPFNIYDLLTDFFELQNIPPGPLMMRNWGINDAEEESSPGGNRHRSHKLRAIQQILELYPHLPFLLIGDSGQKDPEIYHEVVSLYPERIPAVYIRNVTPDPERPEMIRKLAEDVIAAGSTLILADDTLSCARHAVEKGWIAPDTFPGIVADKEADAAPPSALEQALGVEEQAAPPDVVIEGASPAETSKAVKTGAIEAALQTGEEGGQPPDVIVEGDQQKPS